MSNKPQIEDLARHEIEALHAFFVGWFADPGDDALDFAACESAFAPEFAMVAPDGNRFDRDAIVGRLRQARGSVRGRFEIVIPRQRTVWLRGDAVLVEYIEQQLRDGQTTNRRSSALLTLDGTAPRGMVWRYLQETWMLPGEVS